MSSVNTGAVVDNVPPGETLQSGWTKFNTHYHEYDSATLTNRTGASLTAGDVVAIDVANDESVALDDSLSSHRQFVVAGGTVAHEAAGEFVRSGSALVKNQGAITRGNYIIKSATSKAVQDSGVSITSFVPDGAIGYALNANAGSGTVQCMLFGMTFAPGDRTRILARSVTPVEIHTDSTEQTLYSVTIPANTLGSNRKVVVWGLFDTLNDTGATPRTTTFRFKYGGTTFATLPLTMITATSSRYYAPFQAEIVAKDSITSQTAYARLMHVAITNGAGGSASGTELGSISSHIGLAINSAADQTLLISLQHETANANHRGRLHNVFVEIVPTKAA